MKGAKPKGWRQRLGKGSSYRRKPKRKDRAADAKRVGSIERGKQRRSNGAARIAALIANAGS
tara:strand:- start:18644 stop:18829 length:186 start_codon:yes stop_codon:yes gene_type:complete